MDYHDPTPRPEPLRDQHGAVVEKPEGWSCVVLGSGEDRDKVLCGWTDDGEFHQYADTEAIVRSCIAALEGMWGGHNGVPQ